jgi:phage terminase large subunit
MTTSTPTAPDPRADPASRPYRARGAAARAWGDRSAEVVLEGPSGTGKTRAVLEKLHFCAAKYPGMRGLIVRLTRESLTHSALVTFEEQVLPAGSPLLAGAARPARQRYRYPNGSEVVVAGLVASNRDQRAKVMSTEYDLVAAIEATELRENDWEQLTTRLRHGRMPYQQILAECNPAAPSHWLHRRCDCGQARVYFSRHQDNPAVTPEYLERLSRLTGMRRARLYEGRRAAAEGLVYAFDRAVHLIDPFEIPPTWPRFRAIDFGFVNAFCCQWWALDEDGRMYMHREWYRSRLTIKHHAARINALSEGERYEATVADWDAGDRAALAEYGIATVPAEKAVTAGVQAVEDRLAVQPDGKPRLFVFRDALVEADPELVEAKKPVSTEQEFDGYSWPKGQDGRPVKEQPVGVDDHGMDCLRYAVMWADARDRAGRCPSSGPIEIPAPAPGSWLRPGEVPQPYRGGLHGGGTFAAPWPFGRR